MKEFAMDSLAVTIDNANAIATILYLELPTWTATVTKHANAAGALTYRLTQHDGTFTTHQTRLSALVSLLELTTFVLQLEG